MAYIPTATASRNGALAASSSRPSFWSRLVAAMMLSRQRQANAEISRFLLSRGKLTDEVEREIERRFLQSPRSQF